MLIYHKKDNQLFVTQVMHSFNGTEYQTFKKTPSTLPKNLQSKLDYLDDETVYITGDASLRGENSNFFIERTKLSSHEYFEIRDGERRYEKR